MTTADARTLPTDESTDRLATKVPLITVFFWVIKLLSTAGGELTADLGAHMNRIGLLASLIASSIALAAILAVQLRLRRYVPVVYWAVIVAVGVAGTLIADGIVDLLHLTVWQSTLGFSLLLAAVFSAWYLDQRTLSIHTITTRRREAYYWAAVLATFALGTAAGDLTVFSLGWGYGASLLLYGAVFVGAGVAHLAFHANAVVTFWVAYVMTRPLGATFADYLAQADGVGLGWLYPSAAFLAAILALVVYLQVSGRDTPARD